MAGRAYAHGKGVIHRDVKPANRFLCDTGQAKVTDFGIARAVSATTLSSPGVLAGPSACMAPEQWRGDPPGDSASEMINESNGLKHSPATRLVAELL